MRATHRHVEDGGTYQLVEDFVSGKCPQTGEWCDGVLYRGEDEKLRWSERERFIQRFEMIEKPSEGYFCGIQDMMQDVEDFHRKFGLDFRGKPRILEGDLLDFRRKFEDEEKAEYYDEQLTLVMNRDFNQVHLIAEGLEKQLDARIDQIYVILGSAYMQFGAERFKEGWRRVHVANMSKVRAESAEESVRGSTFDVVKPPGWIAPTHIDLVIDHAHKE